MIYFLILYLKSLETYLETLHSHFQPNCHFKKCLRIRAQSCRPHALASGRKTMGLSNLPKLWALDRYQIQSSELSDTYLNKLSVSQLWVKHV